MSESSLMMCTNCRECSYIKKDQIVREIFEDMKMKALKSLVEGIAHELNTPLGVGISASSYNDSIISELHFGTEVSREDLEKLKVNLGLLFSSNQIVLRNLKKTAELINKLKDSVICNKQDRVCVHNLALLIADILTCLKSEFGSRLTDYTIFTDIPSDISLRIGVISLWNVIRNLIDNSLIHSSFEPDKRVILISASQTDRYVEISYCDNGTGFNESLKEKVFEPFFTTKRTLNCIGLGMTAVYNLVTQSMNGTVRCDQSETGGVKVLIRIKK